MTCNKAPFTAKQSMIRVALSFAFLMANLFLLAGQTRAQTLSLNFDYGASAGFAYSPVVAEVKDPGWVVTAFCDSDGILKLISWHDTGSASAGGLVREASMATTSTCTTYDSAVGNSVAISALDNSSIVVTALADKAGDLEISAWTVTSNTSGANSISQLGTTLTETGWASGQVVSIARLSSTQVATTSFSASGSEVTENYVAVWTVPASGEITSAEHASIPAGSDLYALYSIAATGPSQVVTVGDNGAADLQVIAWNISPWEVTEHDVHPGKVTEDTAGMATDGIFYQTPRVALTTWGSSTTDPVVVTAFINNSGYDPELITWSVSSSGKITRTGSASAGGASPYAPIALSVGVAIPAPLTAVSSPSNPGHLDLQAWSFGLIETANFSSFNTTYAYSPTSAAVIDAGVGSLSGSWTRFVTTAINPTTFDLELQAWDLTWPK